jgi:hypothetical protein
MGLTRHRALRSSYRLGPFSLANLGEHNPVLATARRTALSLSSANRCVIQSGQERAARPDSRSSHIDAQAYRVVQYRTEVEIWLGN